MVFMAELNLTLRRLAFNLMLLQDQHEEKTCDYNIIFTNFILYVYILKQHIKLIV